MNWIPLTIITLTLANLFNLGLACDMTQAGFTNVQVQKPEQPRCVEGSLEPGSTFIGPDGVGVKAPYSIVNRSDGDTRDLVEIYIELIDDPTVENPLPPEWSDGEIVSPFYRIGVLGDEYVALSGNAMFDLVFPLPDGLTADDVFIAILDEESDVWLHSDNDELSWWSVPTYKDKQGLVYTIVGALYKEGVIYTLITKLPASTLN